MYTILLLTRYFLCEADFDEFVVHHLSLGFSHIHVFDNGTEFDLEYACRKYGKALSYEKVEGNVCQYTLYSEYINKCDDEYVMPIDDDEYLSLGQFKSIKNFIDFLGKPDCFGFRWKYMFPKNFNRKRSESVLQYCSENNKNAARFFCANGDRSIKCIVKVSEFIRYMDASESMIRNHIPVTKSDIGALLWNGTRTKIQCVRDEGNEPIRLLHCPYKGYNEFITTRGCERLSVCRKKPVIRPCRQKFLNWLETKS